MASFDPYCLLPQGRPEPVSGPLPPPIYEVDELDDLPPRHHPALRWFTAGLILAFAAVSALTVGAGGSVLTGAGPHHARPAKSPATP